MKGFAVLVVCVFVAAVSCDDEAYPTKYDDFNYKELLANDRLVKSYCECVLELPTAKCTKEGETLKKYLPDAITTKCSKCTEKQKVAAKEILNYGKTHKPEECFDKLLAKFDPSGAKRAELDSFLA